MALHIITGKLGGGKTMWALDAIVEELRSMWTDEAGNRVGRYITTNIPLRLPEMAEALHEKYGETFDLLNRVRILSDEETMQFYLHPNKDLDIVGRKEFTGKGNRGRDLPDYTPRNQFPGTLFVIDELPQYFNSRNWQQTGEDTIHYLATSRKAGDDILGITQQVSMVDKQFRGFAQSFIVTKNLGYQKIGFFNLPSRLKVDVYQSDPSTSGAVSMATAWKPIDTAFLGKMYDTAAGAGVSFKKADTQRKKKGVHWSVAVAGIVALLAFIVVAPRLLGSAVKQKLKTSKTAQTNNFVPAGTGNPPAALRSTPEAAARVGEGSVQNPPSLPFHVTGTNWHPSLTIGYYVAEGVPPRVFVSDGRVIEGGDPRLVLLMKSYAILNIDGGMWFVPVGQAKTQPLLGQVGQIGQGTL